MRRLAILGLALAGSLAAKSAGAAILVHVDRATQARLGVVTAPLVATRRTGAVAGFARGLDLTPLATLEADLATAEAARQASSAEAARTATLARADATVSRKLAEAAAAQARGDAARVALLRRRVGLEWGSALGALSPARRSQLISEAAAGRAALVRIDTIGAAPSGATSVELDLGGRGRVRAVVLGPARAGDPRATSPGLLAWVSGPGAAWIGAGTALSATLSYGATLQGVVIPREALLRTAGATFAYVRRDAETFERRLVAGGSATPAGLFAPTGFQAGDPAVVAGAAKLFAAEKPAAKGD